MASARTLIISCAVWGVLACAPAAPTLQAQPPVQNQAKREIVSVPVQRGDAVELLDMLSRLKLLDKRVAVSHSPQNNALILAGDPKAVSDLQQVIGELAQTIAELAARREKQQAPGVMKVFPLRHVSADQAYQDIMRLSLSNPRIAADPQRNRLLLHGDEEALRQMAALLEIIDVPASAPGAFENIQVRIVWLVSKGLADDGGQPPPEDLADVVTALKRKAGVGELSMAAQSIVNVRAAGSSFVANGTAELQLGRARFEAEGRLGDRNDEAAQVEVSLTTDLEGTPAPGGRGGRDVRPLTRLQTAITARPGHAIVLGMTPIDSMESIFVIQLLE